MFLWQKMAEGEYNGSVQAGAHKEKERPTSTYTRGSHLVIAGETALPCMEATKCLQTASLHCV